MINEEIEMNKNYSKYVAAPRKCSVHENRILETKSRKINPDSGHQKAFLSKIQNHISEKTRREIVLLSSKNSVKTQFLGVVEFPSIVLISKIQGSGFSFQFLKNYHNLQFFRVILNFAQECYYLKNKVGVVDFTKARGSVKFQISNFKISNRF